MQKKFQYQVATVWHSLLQHELDRPVHHFKIKQTKYKLYTRKIIYVKKRNIHDENIFEYL